jgi:hypothetical protein
MLSNFLTKRNPDVVYAALVVLVLTLAPALAGQTGATYYVSTTGNARGANTLTAVYSGNSIAPCCPVLGPPVTVYGSASSAPITVTLQ